MASDFRSGALVSNAVRSGGCCYGLLRPVTAYSACSLLPPINLPAYNSANNFFPLA